jgi:hypothetical protein
MVYSAPSSHIRPQWSADYGWRAGLGAEAPYGQALYILAAQSAGCNALHPLAERCARWLLQTQDRVGRDTFLLTHEYLGYMLGVRRPGVTVALGVLQRAGLIAYHRGAITVEDRDGLALAACECYGIITAEYARLLGPPAPRR